MCGLIGIVGHEPVNQALFDGLTVLQHRGQDAAGMMTCNEHGRLFLRKDRGLVRDVFRTRHMRRLLGTMGIGHVRYPTAGADNDPAEAQPFYVNSPFGIALAHNGNLTNARELAQELFLTDRRHINTGSDSEILLNVLAHELAINNKLRLDVEDVFDAVAAVHQRVRGAYAAVAMITGFGILAFRDPNGIRPLIYGQRRIERQGKDQAPLVEAMVASESVAMDALGFERLRDLAPGEALFIDRDGHVHTRQCVQRPRLAPCIFEYVYLARPDSILEGVSVHKARLRMGDLLAQKILREWPDRDIDVVIPIPESSRAAALQVAWHLGVKYREGFVKNRYIARTFIMPGQAVRQKSVRQKLNAIELEFQDKNVLLIDDSIVRGTTSEQIIQMAREAGARRVYFASAAPPVRYPNVYGIDMPAATELVAYNRSVDEIAAAIGADGLIFQDLNDLEDAVRRGNPQLSSFDSSCFSGEYITGDIDGGYLSLLEQHRNDSVRHPDRNGITEVDELEDVLDLHNAS